jgi:hypothetical protein
VFDEEAKKYKNTETDLDVAFYKKAYHEFPIKHWTDGISLNKDNLANDVVERMFTKNLDSAFKQTISVGRKVLVPYAPAGDKIYILHGKDENIDGSVIFDMSNKTKEQTKQEMIDWVENFINYYDPQI